MTPPPIPRLRRGERGLALAALLVLGFFQWLVIAKFQPLFAHYDAHQWTVFMRNYHMSGFDPISYAVITDWHQGFDQLRHPLLAYLLYPLHLANRALWWATGANCAPWLYGALLLACGVCAVLLLHRTLHEVVGVGRGTALLPTAFGFGMAYVLLSTFVADHFGLSLLLLLLALYRGGTLLRRGRRFTVGEAALLFTLTAGVTLSNGALVFLIVAAVNGRSLWRAKPLLAGFALPALLLVGQATAGRWAHGGPAAPIASQQKDLYPHLDRTDILLENFLGETVQLHRRHLLGDALVRRPVVVRYTWAAQYVAEALYVGLFLLGAWVGRRDRFLWLCMAILGFNLLLHFDLGFGLNEVYIMAAHWAFVIPIAMGYLLKPDKPQTKRPTAVLLLALTIYLWAYHGVLLYRYLTWPLNYA